MQDLTVIGIENGALLVSSETGERYRVAIDEVLQSRLRQSTSSVTPGVKVSPREIQSQIRAGMSAEDVARSTGASLEYVERFEGPVLAERLHVVSSALRVAVKVAFSGDPLRGDLLSDDQSSTFGEIIEERLAGLGATDLRWASWKEESGWIVKLTFTADEIDHDARWQYDPKRHSLTPLNSGAITLSQHGEISDGLIPRLRAVDLNGAETVPVSPGIARSERAGLGIDELDAAFPALGDDSDGAAEGDGPRHDSDVPAAIIDEPASPAAPAATTPAANAEKPGRVRPDGSAARSIWGSVSRAAKQTEPREPTAPPVIVEPTPFARSASRTEQESSARAAAAAVNRATPTPAAHNETADLLEALRRRRGEREAATFVDDGDEHDPFGDDRSEHPSHAGLFTRGSSGFGTASGLPGDTRPVAHLNPERLGAEAAPADPASPSETGPVDVPLAGLEQEPETVASAAKQRQAGSQGGKKRRASMPSWDEIVFGARSDDDLS